MCLAYANLKRGLYRTGVPNRSVLSSHRSRSFLKYLQGEKLVQNEGNYLDSHHQNT